MKKYYIADLHFGHKNCLAFDHRPFSSIEDHDQTLIVNWNSVVMPGDHVYVIGDFAYKNVFPASYYTEKLCGHIHLIRGNHDKRTIEYESCFESVDDILKIRDVLHGCPVDVIMCHYWIPFLPELKRGAFMLHGHTHLGSREQRLEEELKSKIRQNYELHRAYNTGVMWQNYYPQTLEQIVARQRQEDNKQLGLHKT